MGSEMCIRDRVWGVDTVRDATDLGTIVGTVPSPRATVHPGDSVRLSMSSGLPSVMVPPLVGLTIAAARERLAAVGLRVGVLDQKFEGQPGTVLAQRPNPGALVTKESSVDLTLSGTLP